jgi:hypothetical protein
MPIRRFLIIYAAVALIGAILVSAPAVAVILLLFSFGLAAPLLLIPTVWVYLTVLWPAVFARSAGLPRVVCVALGVACVGALAVVPPLLAPRVARLDGASILADDVAGKLPTPPKAIEFEKTGPFYGGPNDPLRDAACDKVCQTLLLSREVDSVRVHAVLGGDTSRTSVAIVYSYQERPSCPKAFADADAALPATQAAATRGRCIVPNVGGAWSAGVKFGTREDRNGWRSSQPFLHRTDGLTRYALHVVDAGTSRLVARATELRTRALTTPLYVGYADSYGMELRPGWGREKLTLNASDPVHVLRAFTGLRIEMPSEEPPEPALQMVERILSSGGDEPLGPELMAVINKHLDTLRGRPLTRDDVALLERLVANKRVTDHFRLYTVLERHPEAAAGMIGDILDRLAKPVPESAGHNHSHLAWVLARAPIESLKPHAARILATAETSSEWHLSPLLRVAGRLDVDATDLLARRMAAKSSTVRGAAVYGACTADERWASKLLPAVEGILGQYRGRSYGGNDDLVVALRTLMLKGRDETVSTFLQAIPEADAKRIQNSLTRMSKNTRNECRA